MTAGRAIRVGGGTAVALLAAATLALWAGCSSTGTDSGLGLVGPDGKHPAAFVETHPAVAVKNPAECTPCHGSDLTGGISGQSCFLSACHHDPQPGWDNPTVHGAEAKKAPGSSGFASCQICHGTSFAGNGDLAPSCLRTAECHGIATASPHPAEWTLAPYRHQDTDPANAPACALCHYNEPGGGAHDPVPSPAGVTVTCFNNTLCHAEAAPHALGPVWTDPNPSFHGLTAKQDLAFCQSCHGTPGTTSFDGGVAPTACSDCHADAKAHAYRWYQAPQTGFPPYTASHRNSGNQDVACAICHRVTGPGTGPDPAAPSCYSDSHDGVGCHSEGPGEPNHSVPYLDAGHTGADTTAFDSNCGNCHAVSGTSPVSGAPTCTTCHGEGETGSIAPKSPLTNPDCTSCHAEPPSGSVYPNFGGKHAFHLGLDVSPGNTVSCDTCHAGFGSGSRNHYDRANARPGSNALRVPPGDLAFLPNFDAKAGASSFDNALAVLSCSRVSCHGGQTTPNWRTGSIPETTDPGCRQCHVPGTSQGVPEYNSPFSGLHQFHLTGISSSTGGNALCTECHAMANGTPGANNHFRFLDTKDLLEGPASDTVVPDDKDGAVPAGTYTASAQTCNVTCHGQTHSNFSWTGGANHGVPFLDTRHTAMTAENFPGDCGGCHTEGTSPEPSSSPPTCRTCHQAASPLAAGNCASCHANPPSNPSPTAYPNVEGGHAEHNAVPKVTGVCSVCHTGLASGTQAHYDRANARTGKNALRVPPGDVNIVSTYFGKPVSAGAAFSNTALTCGNVSCHGAITAPNWQTGSIAVNTDGGCRQCHTAGSALGTPQNNSYYSGRHGKHLTGIGGSTGGNALCTECHDMANGTTGANNHFANLDTAAMEGPASTTVEPNGNPAFYNATQQTCGTFTCHGQEHNGFPWVGDAANHPVPFFPSTTHTGATTSSFNGTCDACHGALLATAAVMPSAPVCRSCHTNVDASNPLVTKDCTSCHADPPSSSSATAYPNVEGGHTEHLGLNGSGTPVGCATCHTGLGSPTQSHYDRAKTRVEPASVAFVSPFPYLSRGAASAGFNASLDALNCSNISCHGGQATPNWRNSAIDVNTQCNLCHQEGTSAGIPQYNVYWSGEHDRRQHVDAGCTACHSTAKLADPAVGKHFLNLSTPALDTRASVTIGGAGTQVSTYNPGTSVGTGSCTPSNPGDCHGNEDW